MNTLRDARSTRTKATQESASNRIFPLSAQWQGPIANRLIVLVQAQTAILFRQPTFDSVGHSGNNPSVGRRVKPLDA
jgi:hypothetical protein